MYFPGAETTKISPPNASGWLLSRMRYAHYQCHDALGDIQINNAISALITVCTCICFLLFCTCLFLLLSFILYITPAVRRRGLVFLSLRWSPWLRCTESLSTHRRFTTSRLISIFMGCSSIGSCGANGNTFDRKKGRNDRRPPMD